MRLLIALFLLSAPFACPHEFFTTKITWSQEVSRIVYKRCAACHTPGGKTPMPLLTYQDARPWAKAIKEEVLARRMPPWGAVKGFGEFRNDPSLTQEEILTLADWVEGGAPEGDPKYLPSRTPDPPTRNVQAPAGDRLIVSDGQVLSAPLRLSAVQPLAAAGRIYATRPDGTVEPLLWLIAYKQEWRRLFPLRSAITLPRGTRVSIEPAEARFALIPAPSRAR